MKHNFTPPFRPALVAVTRRGAEHALRLAQHWPTAALFCLEPWGENNNPGVTTLAPPLRDHIPTILRDYNPVCFFCALGAVVRLIAPHLRSKQEDPAVLAVDEIARFVIPVVSGHLGGANDHARNIARILSALPVITTASDTLGTLAVDLLGKDLGWRIEASSRTLTQVAAAVVNDQPVALVQECGNRHWQDGFPMLSATIEWLSDVTLADPKRHRALLWITHREDVETISQQWPHSLVIYRPPKGQGNLLAVGAGCDRGASLAAVEEAMDQALAASHLDRKDVAAVATIQNKKDELCLLELTTKLGLPLTLFAAEQLARVQVPHPSEQVWRHVGTPSVAEAAALLAAQGNLQDLLVPKWCYRGLDGKNVTIAIARMSQHVQQKEIHA